MGLGLLVWCVVEENSRWSKQLGGNGWDRQGTEKEKSVRGPAEGWECLRHGGMEF